jgi:GNAT superfamily N-acetyltransferase
VVEQEATGLHYLVLVTELLQRSRLATDEGGVWEAADLQWAWRRDQHPVPANAKFWLDDDGLPIGAVIATEYPTVTGVDVIAMPEQTELARAAMWPHTFDRMRGLRGLPIEITVNDDDVGTAALLRDNGFAVVQPTAMSCWMAAAERAPIPAIASGYRLRSTAELPTSPHHMAARNGPHVAARLLECSLYRPELDLYIEGPDGDVAGYALFWADPITRVGLLEPMRTEDRHQHKGLGTHLVRVGLDLLAQHECTRLKVTYMEDNEPARLLYTGSGFRPRTPSRTYRRVQP